MKKIALIAALVLTGSILFAQTPGGGSDRPDHPGPGMGPMGGMMGIDWKIGTVVTGEYKKTTGTLTVGQTLQPTFTADGTTYQLWLPPNPEFGSLKTGSSLTIEGLFINIKTDKTVQSLVRAFKVTIDGKEIDVAGPGMMHDRQGPPRQ
jgi:hypothetical protein